MPKRRKNKSGSTVKKVTVVGAGVALVAAAAAGAYFLYGSNEGAKRRKKIKGWMLKAKGEVLEKMETLKDVNEKVYRETVDQVAGKYRKLKNVDSKELDAMVKELKGHWKHIQKHVGGSTREIKREKKKRGTASKTARRVSARKSRKAR